VRTGAFIHNETGQVAGCRLQVETKRHQVAGYIEPTRDRSRNPASRCASGAHSCDRTHCTSRGRASTAAASRPPAPRAAPPTDVEEVEARAAGGAAATAA
jgi:hypothetical protein